MNFKELCTFCEGVGVAIMDYVHSTCNICEGSGKKALKKVGDDKKLWQPKRIHNNTTHLDTGERGSTV